MRSPTTSAAHPARPAAPSRALRTAGERLPARRLELTATLSAWRRAAWSAAFAARWRRDTSGRYPAAMGWTRRGRGGAPPAGSRSWTLVHRHSTSKIALAVGPLSFRTVVAGDRVTAADVQPARATPATAAAGIGGAGPRRHSPLFERLVRRRALPAMAATTRRASAAARGIADGEPPAQPAAPADRQSRSQLPVPAPTLTLAPTRIAHRASRERRRTEQRPPRTTPPALARPVAPSPAPQPVPTAAPGFEPPPGLPRQPARHRGRPAPAESAAATPSPHQIEALTEQVVRRIDRRLVAWRERRGRA